jgi:hypothetical protein
VPEVAAAPVAAGRDQVLAAFACTRVPASPQPASPPPQPATRQPRPPERQAERQAEEIDIGKVDWDKILVAFRIGNIPWPRFSAQSPGTRTVARRRPLSNAMDLHDARARHHHCLDCIALPQRGGPEGLQHPRPIVRWQSRRPLRGGALDHAVLRRRSRATRRGHAHQSSPAASRSSAPRRRCSSTRRVPRRRGAPRAPHPSSDR